MMLGIIPARYASSRLPGKPLAVIEGKSMIQRVYEQATTSKFLNKVIIATDDKRIYDVVRSFTMDVVMTPEDIQTGSDRIAYVAENRTDAEIIVNIQGDEPFIPGTMIDQALFPLLFDTSIQVSTLAKVIHSDTDLLNPSMVKVVLDSNNNALYFSRSPIPFVRDDKDKQILLEQGGFLRHVGLYAYRREALFSFTKLAPSTLEQIEKLEQLRMLENGIDIRVVTTELESMAVDTSADLEQARHFARAHKL